MRASRITPLFALLASAVVYASDEPVTYAVTAATTANAISAGADLTSLEGLPSLSAAELAELQRLAGCEAKMQPGGTPYLVTIHWRCKPIGTERSSFARSTDMRFNPQGVMFALAINPLREDFAPTLAALNAKDLPSEMTLAKSFAKAAREGSDPTLGGIVPLTGLQLDQLKTAQDQSFEIYDPPSERERKLAAKLVGKAYVSRQEISRKYIVSWDDGEFVADLHFDEAGRPVGVVIPRVAIRTTSFSTAR